MFVIVADGIDTWNPPQIVADEGDDIGSSQDLLIPQDTFDGVVIILPLDLPPSEYNIIAKLMILLNMMYNAMLEQCGSVGAVLSAEAFLFRFWGIDDCCGT